MSKVTVFGDLVGQTIKAIEVEPDRVRFALDGGALASLFHQQDCCESVDLHDVNGDWDDLIDSPLVLAVEESNADDPADWKPDYQPESHTWTFYRLGTVKGTVVMRWLGRSNGYYSERVEFSYTPKEDR